MIATHRNIFRLFLLVLLVAIGSEMEAQNGLKWNSWSEGIAKSAKTKKPILVSIINEGCAWCKHMDRTTFQDAEIQQYITDHFIPVELNIQENNALQFNSKDYNLIKKGKNTYHALAIELTGGRYGTPAIIFLDDQAKVLQSLIGYKDAKNFKKILIFYGESYHKKISWHKFLKIYEQL